MNLFTFSSKFKNTSLIRSLLITLSLLSSYHLFVLTKTIAPSDGIHQWQTNFINIQRYAYLTSSKSNIVLVGSSLAANLNASDISPQAINLGIRGGSTQTGIEAVRRNPSKPAILLIEINGTIARKIDNEMIDSIYNPFLYYTRLYIPMLRQEYQPVSVFIPMFASLKQSLKNRLKNKARLTNEPKDSGQVDNTNSKLTETLIYQRIEQNKTLLNEKQKSLLRKEAEYIKFQISQVKKDGVRVILFDLPIEQRVRNTLVEKQIKALMREVFPSNNFEWLSEPPPKQWKTHDGIHLVSSDATDYATFIKNQLLLNNAVK